MAVYNLMQVNEKHIKQLKKGDSNVQKMLFDGLFSNMFRVCLRYIVRTDEAEDCVMKGFLKAFQQIERFEYQGEDSFKFWLKRIMVNEALMALRKQNNFNMVTLDQTPEVSFDDDALQQIEAEYLYDAITLLPTGYRTVLNMFVVEGYSHQEIAETLGISESTSKTQLAKAKAKLKQVITQKQYGYGNT
jgi:RNA polymerase sigma-70 factor (ECF subfamily)